MPLFNSKKVHARKPITFATAALLTPEDIFNPENSTIKMKLTDQELHFKNGIWTPETEALGEKYRETEQLREYCEAVEEENNLLKMRLEVLLDMITETTLQKNSMTQELIALRSDVKNSIKPRKP
nr:PREDICTED: protein chibby homolog 1 [Bemisia tabaci]XP_018910587.1 PREDICTED: protein chibby homolog 1 [Bemisia tabaci]